MSHVYGDSTAFPHDIDYIELVRAGVDCAVHLLAAHHSIRSAAKRSEAAQEQKQREAVELGELFERVHAATAAFSTGAVDRAAATAAQVLVGARSAVDHSLADLDARIQGEVAQAEQIAAKARASGVGAIEQFVARHAAPGSTLCLHLDGQQDGWLGQVTVILPWGVSAVFGADIEAAHPWAKPRRLSELMPNLEIQVPRESGWLSKRVEMTAVRLEKLYVSRLTLGHRLALVRFTKGATGGAGYELRVDEQRDRRTAAIREVSEAGDLQPGEALVLEGGDELSMLSLVEQIRGSALDLTARRRGMISGEYQGEPLSGMTSPRPVAEALVSDMAPVVCEISRRSGAPGELVLRRNLGEGRREETYCTHAELIEKILVLPPDLRTVFSPLSLSEASSVDAPASSGATLAGESRPPDVNNPSEWPGPRDSVASQPNPSSRNGTQASVPQRSQPPSLPQRSQPPSVPPPSQPPSVPPPPAGGSPAA